MENNNSAQLSSGNIGHDALRLALTQTDEEEQELKTQYISSGKVFVVTEVGGKTSGDFQDKASRAILGAALNQNVIQKTSWEIHALLHAAEEAKRGVMINMSSDSHLALKIAIVRKGHWIAVAFYGQSAIHPLSNHERCGLGVMHI